MGKAYTKQFREQAVKLVTEQGYTPGRAARELGIPDTTLESWLKKIGYRRAPLVEAPLAEDPRVLAIQVRQLQKQVRELEMEKEILKKATAYFANQHLRASSS
jgi:transposase